MDWFFYSGGQKMNQKKDVAKLLAERHYQVEPTVINIVIVEASPEAEARPEEPIKLLEVNEATIPSGIMPIEFGPHPSSGILYPSVIMEVTPEEYVEIKQGRLPLPEHWHLGETIPRPETITN
jgi:hypothetical protein